MVSFLCETDIFIDLHGSHPSLPTNLKIVTISNNKKQRRKKITHKNPKAPNLEMNKNYFLILESCFHFIFCHNLPKF